MKIAQILLVYILILVSLIASSVYFGNAYVESNEIKNLNIEEKNSLESKVGNNKTEINKLEKLRNELKKYLNSSEFRPTIKDYKEQLLLEKKLNEFITLNEFKLNFKLGQKKNIDDFKMFIPFTIEANYENVKEINKFLEYLSNLNKVKVKTINFENKNKKFIIQAELLSNKF